MDTGNVYCGRRAALDGDVVVYRNGKLFTADKSLAIRRHSPDGFNWGYCGSGPAQLALALLLDALGSRRAAEAWYQQFKFRVVAVFGTTWMLTQEEILKWYQSAKPEKSCIKEETDYEAHEDCDRSAAGNGTAAEGAAGGE